MGFQLVRPALIYRDWLTALCCDWPVANLYRRYKRFKMSKYDLNQIKVEVTLTDLKEKVLYL